MKRNETTGGQITTGTTPLSLGDKSQQSNPDPQAKPLYITASVVSAPSISDSNGTGIKTKEREAMYFEDIDKQIEAVQESLQDLQKNYPNAVHAAINLEARLFDLMAEKEARENKSKKS